MAPKMTSEHMEARKRQILQGARECFIRKGFHSATMKDICEESGLSSGAIYNHFSGKDEIVAAMAEEMIREHAALFSSALESEEGRRDPLGHVFRVFVKLLLEPETRRNQSLQMELYSEAHRNPRIHDVLREELDTALRWIDEIVEELKSTGRIRSGLSTKSVSRVLFALWQSLNIQLLLNPELDMDAYMKACDAALDGFASGKT